MMIKVHSVIPDAECPDWDQVSLNLSSLACNSSSNVVTPMAITIHLVTQNSIAGSVHIPSDLQKSARVVPM